MELPVEQQILESFNKAAKILIALPKNASTDKLCAAIALRTVLKKMDKQVEAVSPTPVTTVLDFLNQPLDIRRDVSPQDILVVTLNTSQAKLDELSYQADESSVKIFLKPKDGVFSPNDVGVEVSGSGYDLIISLGAQTLEDLGELYQNNAQLFFDTPKLNIDINPSNEYFGTINLVEVTASSTSEVLAQLLVGIDPANVDEFVATCLMAGIIARTHSFQDVITTPRTLTIAADLVSRGARQQDIIKTLYKTKDFAILKLWGRALARIKTVTENSLLYSILTKSDFERTGQGVDALPQVLSELVDNVTGFQTVALLGEDGDNVKIVLAGLPHVDVKRTAQNFDTTISESLPLSGLYRYVEVTASGQTLEQAEKRLIAASQNQ